MFTILTRLATFFALSAVWIALLWFVLRIDFSRQNILSVLSLHALPPLVLWGGWALWKSRAQALQRKAQLRAEEQQQAEQAAQYEAAKTDYEEQMRSRCFAVDCRWVQVASSDLAATALSNVGDNVVALSSHRAEAPASWTQTVASVLENLYTACPGVRYLPVYSADSSLDLVGVSESRHEASIPRTAQRYLSDEGVAAGILGCFERDPSLLGAVFIAADGATEEPAVEPAQIHPGTKQADAIVVMLVTHPRLRDLTPKADNQVVSPHNEMTPFWERGVTGASELNNGLPERVQHDLWQMPIWGQVHKPAVIQGKKSASTWRVAMERALINARLKVSPFVWEKADLASAAPEPTAEESEIECAWLVHNAGCFERAGDHLSALGRALSEFDVNLDLINTGSNLTAEVQLGKVEAWVSLALAIARAKHLNAPTLWANFSYTSEVGFVMPVAVA